MARIQEALNGGRRETDRSLSMPMGILDGVTGRASPVGNAPLQAPTGGGGTAGTGNADWDWLIQKESRGKTTAQNPTSSAFGLGQLIRANREAYAKKLGVSPDTTDRNAQLKMMEMYVMDRYGSFANARRFWEQNNWY